MGTPINAAGLMTCRKKTIKMDIKMKKTITSLVLALAPTLSFADESWTGFNAGIQLGEVDVSSGVNATGNSTVGLHAGYLHDFDGYVLGGEASYDLGGKIVSDEQVKKVDTLRLKVKGGHVFGRAFVYGVVGYAGMDGDAGNMDGYSVGIGVSYRATDKIMLGAEYLKDSFDTSGGKTKADSLNLRLSYMF
jgi:outer membrane immunogenic protein